MNARIMALMAISALAACEATTGAPAEDVAGNWRLDTLGGAPLQGSATLTIEADGRVYGQGPCNAYSSRTTATPPDFALGPIASTRRACVIEGGEAEYFAALQAATEVHALIKDDTGARQLVIQSPKGHLVFSPVED